MMEQDHDGPWVKVDSCLEEDWPSDNTRQDCKIKHSQVVSWLQQEVVQRDTVHRVGETGDGDHQQSNHENRRALSSSLAFAQF